MYAYLYIYIYVYITCLSNNFSVYFIMIPNLVRISNAFSLRRNYNIASIVLRNACIVAVNLGSFTSLESNHRAICHARHS